MNQPTQIKAEKVRVHVNNIINQTRCGGDLCLGAVMIIYTGAVVDGQIIPTARLLTKGNPDWVKNVLREALGSMEQQTAPPPVVELTDEKEAPDYTKADEVLEPSERDGAVNG